MGGHRSMLIGWQGSLPNIQNSFINILISMAYNIFLHRTGVPLRFTPSGEKWLGYLKNKEYINAGHRIIQL